MIFYVLRFKNFLLQDKKEITDNPRIMQDLFSLPMYLLHLNKKKKKKNGYTGAFSKIFTHTDTNSAIFIITQNTIIRICIARKHVRSS